MTGRAALTVAVVLAVSPTVRADRFEATFAVRPSGGFAFLAEDGASSTARVAGGGGSVAFSYGVRNWLDLGGEVYGLALASARYPDASVAITGTPRMGLVTRTTRVGQLRGGATFRLGVGWVPTIFLGFGVGARLRSASTLVSDSHGPIGITPDGGDAKTSFDLAPTARIGLDHRVNRRWTIGVNAGASYAFPIGAPAATMFDACLDVAYTWYPLW